MKAENIGNKADLYRVLAQHRQDFAHPRLGMQGQCDPDLVDRAGRDVLREALRSTGDDAASNQCPVLGRVVVVECRDPEAGPGCLGELRGDPGSECAGAYNRDVPQVVAMPAQRAQCDAQRDAHHGGREKSPGDPRRDPDPREYLAQLGGEQGAGGQCRDAQPRQQQVAQFVGEARAPLRIVQAKCGKQRDDRHGARDREQQVGLGSDNLGAVQAERGGGDRQRNDRIERAQQCGEQRCMRLQERSGHRGIMACAPCVQAMRHRRTRRTRCESTLSRSVRHSRGMPPARSARAMPRTR